MNAPEVTPERLSEIRLLLGISAILMALIASPFIASWYFERKNKIMRSAYQFYCHQCRRGTTWNEDRTLCLECLPSSTPADHQDERPPVRELGTQHLPRAPWSLLSTRRAARDGKPSDVLNLISREEWVKPSPGAHHPIFDVLMESLAGGRQEVRDHLERVLVYKYLHPECFKLPCITISGEGGAGKNEMIEKVLATLFGKQQVAVLGTEEAFGAFNGTMLGKTIVFIDEALVERTKAEQLKRRVGNETIQINMKYGIQGSYDNTPWYWIGGNGTNGAVMLSGNMFDLSCH